MALFPTKLEDLFAFDGLIIGSTDAPYFTAGQQQLIHEFVDRRGGGVLFLGGRDALADGGYKQSALNDLLPVVLPDRKGTSVIAPATVELTAAGRDSLITRIEEDPEKNAEKWKKLPYLLNSRSGPASARCGRPDGRGSAAGRASAPSHHPELRTRTDRRSCNR